MKEKATETNNLNPVKDETAHNQERILCAAVRRVSRRECAKPYHDGTNELLDIEIGYRHHDIYMRFGNEISYSPKDQGFYTSRGRFVDREEAYEIAKKANQILEGTKAPLFSEDLY